MISKKVISLTLATVMVAPAGAQVFAAVNDVIEIPSSSSYTHEQLIGNDRYETGVLTAKKSGKTKNLILVNGKTEKMVDGLCASVLVDQYDATVLPINPDKVRSDARELIDNAENVYIIGMYEAISKEFEDSIPGNVNVKRIGGKDRFETSQEIAKLLSSYNKAYLVNGYTGQADAMSMSPVAAKYKEPILLVKGDSAPITRDKNTDYTVIGGERVVSEALQKQFEADRISGNNRYETNRNVLKKFYPNSKTRYFTNGETLIDALSAASISKNDGITFVNGRRNLDLLENINTVQIGGISYNGELIDINFKEDKPDVTPTPGGGGSVTPPTPTPGTSTPIEEAGTGQIKDFNQNKYGGNEPLANMKTKKGTELKTATKVVFEVNKTSIPTDDYIVLSADKSVLAYLETSGEEKVLHIATSADKVKAPADSNNMFAYLKSAEEIDLSRLDTSKVTNMGSMFFDCNSLKSLDLSGLKTDEVTNMANIFFGCVSLKSLDLRGLKTDKVTNMAGMFYECLGLKSVNLSGLNTIGVTDMKEMFDSCIALESINLSGLDTSQVEEISGMFYKCSSLTSVVGLGNLDTSKVINMDNMFRGCERLSGEITIRSNPTYDKMFGKFSDSDYACSACGDGKYFTIKYKGDATKETVNGMRATGADKDKEPANIKILKVE